MILIYKLKGKKEMQGIFTVFQLAEEESVGLSDFPGRSSWPHSRLHGPPRSRSKQIGSVLLHQASRPKKERRRNK